MDLDGFNTDLLYRPTLKVYMNLLTLAQVWNYSLGNFSVHVSGHGPGSVCRQLSRHDPNDVRPRPARSVQAAA